jgi:hypothetical protein
MNVYLVPEEVLNGLGLGVLKSFCLMEEIGPSDEMIALLDKFREDVITIRNLESDFQELQKEGE